MFSKLKSFADAKSSQASKVLTDFNIKSSTLSLVNSLTVSSPSETSSPNIETKCPVVCSNSSPIKAESVSASQVSLETQIKPKCNVQCSQESSPNVSLISNNCSSKTSITNVTPSSTSSILNVMSSRTGVKYSESTTFSAIVSVTSAPSSSSSTLKTYPVNDYNTLAGHTQFTASVSSHSSATHSCSPASGSNSILHPLNSPITSISTTSEVAKPIVDSCSTVWTSLSPR